jgi:hypothetical protein
MKKPAIFIDAFLSDESRHEIFKYNVTNFIKNDWDVFIISNKMSHFDSFAGVKYLEYDPTNRVLPDRNRYKLKSRMHFTFNLYDGDGNERVLYGYDHFHGFTNWTLLYNMRRMAEVAQRFGHTHFITCEYDMMLKNYDLMSTLFKDFGKTENSKKCMVHPGTGFFCMTNIYLISVDTVLSTIPVLNTEDDYEQLLIRTYGTPLSTVYEQLFADLFIKYIGNWEAGDATGAELIPASVYWETVDGYGKYMSDGADGNNRVTMAYNKVYLTPVNDNSQFFVYNTKESPVFLDYTTEGYHTTFLVHPHTWHLLPANTYATAITSDMLVRNHKFTYDLINRKYEFTFK